MGDSGPEELDLQSFSLRVIGELAGTLQDVAGLDEAAGFVSLVGQAMGHHIDQLYDSEPRATSDQLAQVLVDLKRRIEGGFRVVEVTDSRIVLRNDRCPFGAQVAGRPALCMMTSNVFGTITASHNGYARVEIPEALARGDDECHVIVHLIPGGGTAPGEREYFKD